MPDATQTTLIYQRLRLAILDLDLAPGARLTERGLEAEFNASRTPVRAALVRLEGDGLAQRNGRGWIVSPIDLAELEALAEFREAVESAVVRLAVERATDDDLRALERQLRARGAATEQQQDLAPPDFHLDLARLSGNRFLASAVEGIMTRLARTRWLEVRTSTAGDQAAEEHGEILRALLARDSDEAATLAVAHIRRTRARLADSLTGGRKGLAARGVSIVGASEQAATASATSVATPRGH